MKKTALAAMALVTLSALPAQAQTTRYFARMKLSGATTSSSTAAPKTYPGYWRLQDTGQYCPEGYNEVLLFCSDAGTKSLPYSSCDPDKRPYTQPPCPS